MKILFVLGLAFVLALLVYRAVRPYYKLIRQFFQTVRHFQNVTKDPSSSAARRQPEKLVECEVCHTWIPQSRALAANSVEYCSQECLDRSGVRRRKTRII